MSKYLLMADVHLSNKLPYSVPTEGNLTDRFVKQIQMLAEIDNIGKQNDVDGIIIAGDLFDKSVVDPVTFFEAAKALQSLSETAPVYILPGNHDSVTIAGGPYITDVFSLLGMEIIDVSNPIINENVVFYPLQYMSIEDSYVPLETLRDNKKEFSDVKNHILLFHNTVLGARNGKYISDIGFDPQSLLEGFDFAVGGHYHEPHSVYNRVEYIGAPMQHHFGDCGKKNCVMLMEFDSGGFTRRRIELKGPKFFQYNDANIIRWEDHRGDYVRLTIESTVPELQEMAQQIKDMKTYAKENGVRFYFQHNPIYQHAMRLDTNRDELSYVALLDDYVKSDDVNTGSLDMEKLIEYGQKMLKKAVDKNGNH